MADIVRVKKLGFVLFALGVICVLAWGTLPLYSNTVVEAAIKATTGTVTVPKTWGGNVSSGETVDVKKYDIKISNKGGRKQLNYCAEGFTEMVYRSLENKTLLASHNNCGTGASVLAMTVGDIVHIDNVGEYQVVETVDAPKRSPITVVNSIEGGIVLQTCYFKSKTLKFVGLKPLPDSK